MIEKYSNFQFKLISERLHLNKEVDLYSDQIYDIIKNSDKLKFEFYDVPQKLNINKLIINLKDNNDGNLGSINLDKCKKTDKGWIIEVDLVRNFKLNTLKHELNHVLRLTLIGKDKMISNLNYLKSSLLFSNSNNDEIDRFFLIIYLANDEEINATISELNGYVKEVMSYRNIDKLSDAYKKANMLIKFSCKENFKSFSKNDLNKFFYLLEENKTELDTIQKSNFSTIRTIFKAIKDILFNKVSFNDNKLYNPNKNDIFYDRWINKQGNKLLRRIYSLYDHYS
jgi:hypothetical protein